MKILVAVASRHGSTHEIAEQITATLTHALKESGEVDLRFAENVTSVEDYDAFVLGSAVYFGQWLPSAKELIESHLKTFRDRPLWLFSSGPAGRGSKTSDEHVDIRSLIELTAPRDHRVFAGKIDKSAMRFTERAVLAALHVNEGDYRDWTSIKEWSREIGEVLSAIPSKTTR